jgi:nucleoside-diphosphate-sugar epimerase
MAHIFLTGATGSIGPDVVSKLLDRGFTITALVRQPVEIGRCRTVAGTLERLHQVSGAVAECDAVVHLACNGSDKSNDVLQQDIAGGAELIDAWTKGPFVFASTAALYEPQSSPMTEGAPLRSGGLYARSKAVMELQLRLAERQQARGGAALLRPSLIFGARSPRPGNVFADILALCRLGTRFVFDSEIGLARHGCSFISGGDFGHAIAEALTRDISGPFNIAGGFCTWRELIETINRIAGTKGGFVVRADTRPQAGEFRLPQSRTELDTTAFQKATGFQPRETLEEIVEAFVRTERAQPA